jgi:hypothetical protein
MPKASVACCRLLLLLLRLPLLLFPDLPGCLAAFCWLPARLACARARLGRLRCASLWLKKTPAGG